VVWTGRVGLWCGVDGGVGPKYSLMFVTIYFMVRDMCYIAFLGMILFRYCEGKCGIKHFKRAPCVYSSKR
jgi:hypothetical protein